MPTLQRVEPDWDGFLRNIHRQATPERVFHFEHGLANNIIDEVDQKFSVYQRDVKNAEDAHDRYYQIHQFLGMELLRIFPAGGRMSVPTVESGWVDESKGAIQNWDDFERFPWLKPEDADLSVLDYYEKHLPQNMRAFHVQTIWELVRDLIGFESFCFMLYENPDLIDAVIEKVFDFCFSVFSAMCDYDCFGVVYLADDLGYKTSTMLAPNDIRRLFIPLYKRLTKMAHDKGKLLFFHSCGQIYTLIDDLINDVKIDAKHSFEDVILPVTEAKKQFGDRLSLLGGMDVDFLARAKPEAIRAKTREVLDICMPNGGYCLGSGNWVSSYIPFDNYLAMLQEARRYA